MLCPAKSLDSSEVDAEVEASAWQHQPAPARLQKLAHVFQHFSFTLHFFSHCSGFFFSYTHEQQQGAHRGAIACTPYSAEEPAGNIHWTCWEVFLKEMDGLSYFFYGASEDTAERESWESRCYVYSMRKNVVIGWESLARKRRVCNNTPLFVLSVVNSLFSMSEVPSSSVPSVIRMGKVCTTVMFVVSVHSSSLTVSSRRSYAPAQVPCTSWYRESHIDTRH